MPDYSLSHWQQQAAQLQIDARALIGSERCNAMSGQSFDVISPIDGRVLAQAARCQKEDVDHAVATARKAFHSAKWAQVAPRQRKKVMFKWAELIEKNAETLALLETLDMGKPISASLSVDVMAAAQTIRWYAEAVDKIYDEIAPTASTALALIRREPAGVVGAIVPWNYPMLMTTWKVAPALAAGNAVVLKPSEKSPLSALMLAALALEAGMPPGILNVVPGFGLEAGEALALSMDVNVIAFTGSTGVGKRIMQCAGLSNLKRPWTELGGKSAVVVFDDYSDMDKMLQAVLTGMFYNQGESCNAPSRLLVQDSCYEQVVEKAARMAKAYQPSHPLDPQCRMGAIVDDIQMQRVLSYIASGRDQGAVLSQGGNQVLAESGGYFIEPTVFSQVKTDMRIAAEEIFGPVLSILRFSSEEQAIAMANDSVYGLQAGVWTSQLSRAHRVAQALQAGTVHVNQYDEDDITVPFGGYKQSGNGRDKSLHAFDKYTELKTTWIKL